MLGVDSIKNALNASDIATSTATVDTNIADIKLSSSNIEDQLDVVIDETNGQLKVGLNSSLSKNIDSVSTYKCADSSNTGACIDYRLLSAASTNLTLLKANAGRIYNIIACNNSAAAKFLKFYNKASAPAPASDTPIMTIIIPANQTISMNFEIGKYFDTGIAFAVTGAIADTDTTAISANDVVLNISYI